MVPTEEVPSPQRITTLQSVTAVPDDMVTVPTLIVDDVPCRAAKAVPVTVPLTGVVVVVVVVVGGRVGTTGGGGALGGGGGTGFTIVGTSRSSSCSICGRNLRKFFLRGPNRGVIA
jgi:hypothetical protein